MRSFVQVQARPCHCPPLPAGGGGEQGGSSGPARVCQWVSPTRSLGNTPGGDCGSKMLLQGYRLDASIPISGSGDFFRGKESFFWVQSILNAVD